jgi:KaiC/GvpD/RAD55 family RecA-like ATPase
MSKKTEGLIIYKNGAISRTHNRRILLKETEDGSYTLELYLVDGVIKPKERFVQTKVFRKRIRGTKMKLSRIALEAITSCFIYLTKTEEERKLSNTNNP